MKKLARKLQLNSDTLRRLDQVDLHRVQGGDIPHSSPCPTDDVKRTCLITHCATTCP